jgi:hypothetical protein
VVHQNVGRRGVETPIPHEFVIDGSADRAILSGSTGSGPKSLQAFPSLSGAAARHAVGECHRVHGAGAGTADGLDAKPLVLEKLVEHPQVKAPCEPPPCKASLIVFLGCAFIQHLQIQARRHEPSAAEMALPPCSRPFNHSNNLERCCIGLVVPGPDPPSQSTFVVTDYAVAGAAGPLPRRCGEVGPSLAPPTPLSAGEKHLSTAKKPPLKVKMFCAS